MSVFFSWYHRLPIIRELDRILVQTASVRNTLAAELQSLRALHCRDYCDRLRAEKSAGEGPLCLHRFEHQVCSQNGEDGVLVEIFRRIGDGRRTFAEVGVGDGIENNTAFLHSLGWSGAWIDAAPLPSVSPTNVRFLKAFTTSENIAELFTQLAVPRDVDLCSLDIDQNTFYLWEALAAWQARVVVIEYNASLPPSVDWQVAYVADRVWDGTINFGASLKALERLGRRLGYTLIHCEIIGANAFFVRNDLVGAHFTGPFDAETHYEPPRYSYLHTLGHRRSLLDRALPPVET
ncbi:MAG: hypothetical protein RL077_2360 [Verrucomicrobiota bacterium]|jgi:hypothetical protein